VLAKSILASAKRENVLILKYKLDAVDFAERPGPGCRPGVKANCADRSLSRALLSEVLRYLIYNALD